VNWLADTAVAVPQFYSVQAFRKTLPRANVSWALDSGAYTELSKHGRWRMSPSEYVARVRQIIDTVGHCDFACTQDWVCGPGVFAKTELTVTDHQKRTVQNFLELAELAPDVPWVPALQGWHGADYYAHAEMYAAAGVSLQDLARVGIGSIASRQEDPMVGRVVRGLHAAGIKLHGFGVKKTGLKMYGDALASADSQAWVFDARFSNRARIDRSAQRGGPALAECRAEAERGEHPATCTSCKRYALWWRRDVMEKLAGRLEQSTHDQLFVPDSTYQPMVRAEINTRQGAPRQIISGQRTGRGPKMVPNVEPLFGPEGEDTE
jgi:hypothetical protein